MNVSIKGKSAAQFLRFYPFSFPFTVPSLFFIFIDSRSRAFTITSSDFRYVSSPWFWFICRSINIQILCYIYIARINVVWDFAMKMRQFTSFDSISWDVEEIG